MATCRGQHLALQISKFSPMSISEALSLQRAIFTAGPASREEAEAMFDACSVFEKSDTAWKCAFVETITDHVLGQGEEYGFLEFDAEDWLIDLMSDDGVADESVNFELLQSILEKAKNASMRLGRFGLFSAMNCGNMYEAMDGNITEKTAAIG
jgi:hypothetical protein